MSGLTPATRTLALFIGLAVLLAACGAPAVQTTTTPTVPVVAESATLATSPSPATAGEATTEAAATAVPAAETRPQETLLFAADVSGELSLDPAEVYEIAPIQVVGNLYETLVSFDPGDPTLKPVLARSWEIQDTGEMWTLTFNLQEQAKFASGRPVTAGDVIYSWSRVIDLNKSPAFLFIDIAQLKKENMRAVDLHTVEVKLPKTVSPQVFLSILTFTAGGVVDKQAVEANAGADLGSTWLHDHSAGSGPYVLERWERDVQLTLNANPNYWGKAPALKRVIMRSVTDVASLQSAIETGDADIVQNLGAEQVKALENNQDVQIVKANTTQLVYIGMNAKSPPLDKVDVREAIRYAIDYDEIVNNLLAGNGKLVQEIIPAGLFGHTGLAPFKQDVARGKELLARAGVAEGTEIELLVPTGTAPGGIEWRALAARVRDDVQKIGLKLNIKEMESGLLDIYRAQKAQMVLINWASDFPDPDSNVTPFTSYEARSIAWRNAWEAPEIARLGKDAAVEQDTARRAELYRQLTERVLHEGPYAILYQPTRTYGIRKNIQGFAYDPADTPRISFWLISKQ